MLSALSLAGELTFDDVPDNIPKSEIEFTQRWENWAKANKEYLTHNEKLFERSVHFADILQGDAESLTGYSHIRGDRGFVFLINPGAAEQIGELTLALDAPSSTHFVINEIYPGGFTLRGPLDGEYSQGDTFRVTVPGKQVRILWIAPASAARERHNFLPEDARLTSAGRYVSNWKVVSSTSDMAHLQASFNFPQECSPYISASIAESAWSREPWAYDKAYLVFLFKDENVEQNNQWVPDQLFAKRETLPQGEGISRAPEALTAIINGVPKTLHPFTTGRNQVPGKTRCYLAGLGNETRAGSSNQIEIKLPIERGLVFSGAYLDLPDQMPYGENPLNVQASAN